MNRQRVRWYIAGLGLLVFACAGPPADPIPWVATEGPVVTQETWSFVLVVSDVGTVTARVEAGHMVQYQSDDQLRLGEGVRVYFFRATGTVKSTVFSDSAVVSEDGTAFTAYRNVRAASDSGIVLLTTQLQWDQQRDKIFTDEFVTVVTGSDTLRGVGFQADPDLRSWQIRKPQGVSASGLQLE